MIRSKTKKMKQAFQGMILTIKEKEDSCELRATPNWVALGIPIDEDALSPTSRITLENPIYKTKTLID